MCAQSWSMFGLLHPTIPTAPRSRPSITASFRGRIGATVAASQEAKDRFGGKAGDQVRAAVGDCHFARVTPGIILHGPPHDLLRNFQRPRFIESMCSTPGILVLGEVVTSLVWKQLVRLARDGHDALHIDHHEIDCARNNGQFLL